MYIYPMLLMGALLAIFDKLLLPKNVQESEFILAFTHSLVFSYLCGPLAISAGFKRVVFSVGVVLLGTSGVRESEYMIHPDLESESTLITYGIWLTMLRFACLRLLHKKQIELAELGLVTGSFLYTQYEQRQLPDTFLHLILVLFWGIQSTRNILLLVYWLVISPLCSMMGYDVTALFRTEPVDGAATDGSCKARCGRKCASVARSPRTAVAWRMLEYAMLLAPVYAAALFGKEGAFPEWYVVVYLAVFPFLVPQAVEKVRPINVKNLEGEHLHMRLLPNVIRQVTPLLVNGEVAGVETASRSPSPKAHVQMVEDDEGEGDRGTGDLASLNEFLDAPPPLRQAPLEIRDLLSTPTMVERVVEEADLLDLNSI